MAAARATDVSKPRPAPRAAVLLIGATAVLAQVLLLRAMLVVSHGNEVSLGLTLAAWLAWTAFGSGVLGRLGRGPRLLPILFTVNAAALPLALLAVAYARSWSRSTPGETLGPLSILGTAVLALACFCPVSGWLMAAAMRCGLEGRQPGEVAARAYILEALGSALAGILAGLVLLQRSSPLEIAAAVAALNLLAALWLLWRQWLVRLTAAAALAAAVVLMLPGLRAAELASVSRDWPRFRVIAAYPSRYGQLAILENEGVTTFVENGQPLFSTPDLPSAEQAAHFALLEHAEPCAVLLIGGGPSGTLGEILKHPSVRRLDYVELDPAVLAFARRSLPQSAAPMNDARVHAHALDARLFVRTSAGRYDVMIVNLPDPQNAQLNRFYTQEFFREAAAHLSPGGVLSLQVRGSEDYVSPQQAGFLNSLRGTLLTVFPRVVVLPGDPAHIFAGGGSAPLTADPRELARRLHARGISALYVRGYYTEFNFSPDRVGDLDARLAAAPVRVNRDFAPSAYYFNVVLWSEQFGGVYRTLFRWLAAVPLVYLAGLLLLVAGLLAVALRRRRSVLSSSVSYAVAVMGFTAMALQVLLLLGFQAVYGYVFEQVAVIAAACMAGLGLGSWIALRCVRADQPAGRLLALQIAAAAAPLAFVGALELIARGYGRGMTTLAAQAVFPALALLSGIIPGLQFPLALRASLAAARGRPGTLYALDLVGSCAGALLLSTYFIPVYGFAATAALVALLNVPAILLLLPSSLRRLASR